ncbi:MAG TPA: sulfite exporter TauE/SafE family protein [Chloroflexota bacterium]|nr:sulfite exporter TauE/SafE family protein [Chloroflexota bacterium]
MGALPLAAGVGVVALLASTLSAVTGFGGAVILLPVLIWAFGPRAAVPILTVVQVVGNASRVLFNRRDVVPQVAGWFALGAVPLSVAGALVFSVAPAPILQRVIGVFLLGAVVWRHTSVGRRARVGLRGFLGIGALFGFLSAVVGTVGPLAAPFFLSHGLVRGAYIGTEALTALTMHAVKLVAYGRLALLDLQSLALGAAIGVIMVAGSYAGKRIADRLPDRAFRAIVEATLVVAGVQLLLAP